MSVQAIKYRPPTRPFPEVAIIGGREYVQSEQLDEHIALIVADATGQPPVIPEKTASHLVPLRVAAERMGISTRTLKRRIAEGKKLKGAA